MKTDEAAKPLCQAMTGDLGVAISMPLSHLLFSLLKIFYYTRTMRVHLWASKVEFYMRIWETLIILKAVPSSILLYPREEIPSLGVDVDGCSLFTDGPLSRALAMKWARDSRTLFSF